MDWKIRSFPVGKAGAKESRELELIPEINRARPLVKGSQRTLPGFKSGQGMRSILGEPDKDP